MHFTSNFGQTVASMIIVDISSKQRGYSARYTPSNRQRRLLASELEWRAWPSSPDLPSCIFKHSFQIPLCRPTRRWSSRTAFRIVKYTERPISTIIFTNLVFVIRATLSRCTVRISHTIVTLCFTPAIGLGVIDAYSATAITISITPTVAFLSGTTPGRHRNG